MEVFAAWPLVRCSNVNASDFRLGAIAEERDVLADITHQSSKWKNEFFVVYSFVMAREGPFP